MGQNSSYSGLGALSKATGIGAGTNLGDVPPSPDDEALRRYKTIVDILNHFGLDPLSNAGPMQAEAPFSMTPNIRKYLPKGQNVPVKDVAKVVPKELPVPHMPAEFTPPGEEQIYNNVVSPPPRPHDEGIYNSLMKLFGGLGIKKD
jgi:hypothetical protein